ncbi:MAG: DUF4190 domain-containing protein [Planctomycetaceae bacterium]|nr:DUF4190 domain-containing protein [Planctomycetaceae bacterium]
MDQNSVQQWGDPDTPGGSTDNPYFVAAAGGSWQRLPQQSALAVISLVAGITAIPMMCCTIIGFPLSLVAIICGHISRFRIRKSGGMLTGQGMALAGLIMGYLCLTICAAGIVMVFVAAPGPTVWTPPGTPTVESGVSFLKDSSPAAAGGVDEEDRALARHFAEAADQVVPSLMSSPEDVAPCCAWCQLEESRCLLMIRVPDFDRIDESRQLLLREVLWLAARQSLGQDRESGIPLYLVIVDGKGEIFDIASGFHDLSEDFDAGLTAWGASPEEIEFTFLKYPS